MDPTYVTENDAEGEVVLLQDLPSSGRARRGQRGVMDPGQWARIRDAAVVEGPRGPRKSVPEVTIPFRAGSGGPRASGPEPCSTSSWPSASALPSWPRLPSALVPLAPSAEAVLAARHHQASRSSGERTSRSGPRALPCPLFRPRSGPRGPGRRMWSRWRCWSADATRPMRRPPGRADGSSPTPHASLSRRSSGRGVCPEEGLRIKEH